MNTRRLISGFTLLELVIVVAIVAILAAVAVPSMESSMKKSSVKSLQRSYLRALSYARSEAVARNKLVSICPSVDGNICDTANHDWSGGWLIFIDDGDATGFGNGVYEPDEELLRVYENTGSTTVALVDPDASNNDLDFLSWNFRGFVDQRALLVVCDRGTSDAFARGVVVERSGRAMLTQDWDDDGVHESVYEDASGTSTYSDLSCS